ncbi:MAG TPA: putative lipopolysaccharide heptosyltransferase III [Chthoniobacterales bacterium]|nr:putative lipopolysaccharide heptosyltransferase III [Chthoniobacterales bacterium]
MNILLIQLKRIGDLILTTPAIAAVREKFPRAEISLVVSAGTRELLPAIPGVDRTLIAKGRITSAAHWLTVARRKYDYCLDFTRNDRSAFLTLLSGAGKRITADHLRQREKLRSLSYNELVPIPIRLMHTVDYHLGLLAPLGVDGASQALNLRLPMAAHQKAQSVLADSGTSEEFILVHPGSARVEKFWEAERWAEVIEHAAQRQLACVLTGGTSPLEQNHIAQIKRHSRARCLDLSGRIDLLTLAAMIDEARLVVTVDSAPMHLAAAMQTPQVVLFGPTNPLHWRPRFNPAVILQAGQPAPVTEFSPRQRPVPMNEISTEQVIHAMEVLLQAPRGATV